MSSHIEGLSILCFLGQSFYSQMALTRCSIQIILPEMATVHFAVYDEEKELLGQRFIPLCAIMAGYRYIPLRNHHNEPLPLAALFVHITVEDWIHSDLKGECIGSTVLTWSTNFIY